jgi:hypothetical protein
MIRFILFFLCLFGTAHLQPSLLTKDSRPTQELQELLEFLGMDSGGDLQQIVSITQQKWVQLGKERWEYEPVDEEKKPLLLPYFKNLGMVNAIDARQIHYDYALIHGALHSTVQKRIAHLVTQFNRGVRFKQVVLLTGQRLLDPKTSEKDLPFQTEAEMMLWVWENFDMPQELKKIPYLLIDATAGNKARPNTADTLAAWLKTNPKPGSCLLVSSQPFCGYQDCVAKTILPPSFVTETIGKESAPGVTVAVYLDNLGRWLYQEINCRGLWTSPTKKSISFAMEKQSGP